MISLRPKKDGGGYDIVDYETAPIPPSLTTKATSTGNYGLADDARMVYKELALKQGEVPGPVVPKQVNYHPILKGKTQEITVTIGRGRGRRVLHVPSMEPAAVVPKVPEQKTPELSKEPVKEDAEEGAVGLDGATKEMETPEVKEEIPSNKLPPRYFETTDSISYEKVAGLFLQGLQSANMAEMDMFDDFEGDSFAPPQGSKLTFKEMTEKDDQEGVTRANEGGNGDAWSTKLGGAVKKAEGSIYRDSEEDNAVIWSSTTNTVRPAGRPKGKPAKANGYCLFIRHRAFQTGTKGSINELMSVFDEDWKKLPEQEKQEWKRRAKSGGAWKSSFHGSSDRRGVSRQSSRTSSVSSTYPQKSSVDHTSTSDTRSVTSETSTTTNTTVSCQEKVDADDWY